MVLAKEPVAAEPANEEESGAEALMNVDPTNIESIAAFVENAEGLGGDPSEDVDNEDDESGDTPPAVEPPPEGLPDGDPAQVTPPPEKDPAQVLPNEEAPPAEEIEDQAELEKQIKTLPEAVRKEVQSVIDKRIGKEVKKRKTLETQLEIAESNARRFEEQMTELRSQQEEAVSANFSTDVNPLMLADDAKIDAFDQHLAKLEKLAIKFWDGHEDEQTGEKYSAEDVRARYTAIREQRERDIPAARKLAAQRAAGEAAAKKLHPQLFDKSTKEHAAVSAYLKAYPQLRMVPNIHVVLGDAIAHERWRIAEAEKKGKGAPPSAVPAKPPVPPVVSSDPPATRGRPTAPRALDMTRVVETGGSDPDAIANAVSQMGL